jgi:hypothetical protein
MRAARERIDGHAQQRVMSASEVAPPSAPRGNGRDVGDVGGEIDAQLALRERASRLVGR